MRGHRVGEREQGAPVVSSSSRADRPTETPEMALPSNMPRMGMKYCKQPMVPCQGHTPVCARPWKPVQYHCPLLSLMWHPTSCQLAQGTSQRKGNRLGRNRQV